MSTSPIEERKEGRFRVVREAMLEEEVWIAISTQGMPVRVVPTQRFKETAAVVSVGYGATDIEFTTPGGDRVVSPLGTAHYLEHKLFEDEDLAVFDRFAARGARVNAMTGFTRTSYFFQARDRLEENLGDLLRLVSNAHLTAENVEKERGIIAQEVRMYEDSPQQGTLFGLLSTMYAEHPVRYALGGTVESIGEITAESLRVAFDSFYRTGNAALAVAGPVDPNEVLAMADACDLASGDGPVRKLPDDDEPPRGKRLVRELPVARPKLFLGFREEAPVADAEARAQRQLLTSVLLHRLFGGSSTLRESLHERGDVDDSLSSGVQDERTFGFALIACETDDVARSEDALRKACLRAAPDTLRAAERDDPEWLDRLRRRSLGGVVRAFESVQGVAFRAAEEALHDMQPFRSMERLQGLTSENIQLRAEELFQDARMAVTVRKPAE